MHTDDFLQNISVNLSSIVKKYGKNIWRNMSKTMSILNLAPIHLI